MKTIAHTYLCMLFLTAFSSLVISYKTRVPLHLRFLAWLLGLTFLVELAALYLPKIFHIRNNYIIYNVFVLIEFPAYAWFYLQIITLSRVKILLRMALLLFPLIWGYSLFFVFGINTWNSYIIVTGDILVVFMALAYLYQLSDAEAPVPLRYHSEFWIALGMLLYYSCQLPYMGTLNYLLKNYPGVALLLNRIIIVICILMYCTFSYAYLCRAIRKTNTRNS